jgi:hypothetical protein
MKLAGKYLEADVDQAKSELGLGIAFLLAGKFFLSRKTASFVTSAFRNVINRHRPFSFYAVDLSLPAE